MEGAACSLDFTIVWSSSSKNSLHNVNGYSPNQLVFEQSSNMHSVLILGVTSNEASS